MDSTAHAAARLLWTCRQSGTVIDALPPALRPNDHTAGQAIQAALPAVADRCVVGWKIAAASAAGQAHIQVDGPLPGRILDAFVQPMGATLSLAGNRMRVVEPECAFGPAAPAAWRTVDLAAHRVHATVCDADGRIRCTREGEGRALLGDPLTALTWLANELSSLGIGLRPGDWASCGTCMVPLSVQPNDRVVADYGAFGRVEIGLSD